MIRVGIDIQTTLGDMVGFGSYVSNLIHHLPLVDPGIEYVFFRPRTEHDLRIPSRFFWDQVGLPLRAAASRCDLLHQPCFSAPLLFPGTVVVTAHDLIARLATWPINLPSRLYFSYLMPLTYQKAARIIAISKNTAHDLERLLGISPRKIRIVPHAPSPQFRPLPARATRRILARHKISPPYILHVGTIEPRKNLVFLVRLYAAFAKGQKRPPPLVIAGKRGWGYEPLFTEIAKQGIEGRVRFLGYVPFDDLPALYSAASVFVFPSLYEGFGLPPLEAMACGTPVIAANTSSLPEVVSEAGILLPKDDEAAWIAALEAILSRPRLASRLRARGLQQASRFTWERTARETVAVYREALEGRS